MIKKKIVFDYNLCIACGICANSCPTSAIELSNTRVDNYRKAYPVVNEKCIGCEICANACPIDAVSIEK